MKCNKCEKFIEDDSNFCYFCGKKQLTFERERLFLYGMSDIEEKSNTTDVNCPGCNKTINVKEFKGTEIKIRCLNCSHVFAIRKRIKA